MLKIRLRRIGAIRQPHYRIVVADARAPRDGAFVDILGHYNPRTEPATIQVDVAKYDDWKRKGAQPTDAVARLVRQFNRAERKAAAASEAGETASPANRRTSAASGKGITRPPAAASVDASGGAGAVDTDAPMNEAMAEATRDGGADSAAMTGTPAPSPAVDNTDEPVLEAATETPVGALEGAADTDTAS